MKKPNKKKILILGANSGLGFALVQYYIKDYEVIAVSKSINNLKMIKSKNLFIIQANLISHHPLITDSVDKIFNCVGIASYKKFLELSDNDIERVININLITAIKLTKSYIGNLTTGGIFVHIGSYAGLEIGHSLFSVYSASKIGLIGLVNSLAEEFKFENKHFLVVIPPAFESNICKNSVGGIKLKKLFEQSETLKSEKVAQEIVEKLPFSLQKKETILYISKPCKL